MLSHCAGAASLSALEVGALTDPVKRHDPIDSIV